MSSANTRISPLVKSQEQETFSFLMRVALRMGCMIAPMALQALP